MRQWLAPYTPGRPHLIAIDLPIDAASLTLGGNGDDALASIAMLRVFNYNKSRVHAARGVRACEIYVDRCVCLCVCRRSAIESHVHTHDL